MSTNKKTILYLITQSETGGAQRYVFDLAKNLKNEFNIAVASGEPWAEGELAKQCDRAEIKYYFIRHLVRRISPFNDLLALFEIIRLIKRVNPDVIHLNSSKVSVLGSLAYQIIKVIGIPHSAFRIPHLKMVYTVHGWVMNEPLPFWQKFFYKCAEKWTARWKDKLICVSEFDQQTALKENIAPAGKLVTIHNGIEPINFLSKEEARRNLILNLKFQISNFCIGTIGNLYKTKGHEFFIKAVGILAADYGQPVSAVIIGEGGERKNLEKLIADLKLKERVFLAGKIDNAARLLLAFDIYVCASVKEGLSYTVLEAMQAGLPVVATRVGGNPELITDGKEGLLAEPANPEKLAEKIMKIIKSDNRKSLGPAARQKALAEFNMEKMVIKTKKLY